MDDHNAEPECGPEEIIEVNEVPVDDMPRTKTFKEYYANPEYRRRHLDEIMAKVECPVCNSKVARCNMSKHSRTKKHQKLAQVVAEKPAVQNSKGLTPHQIAKIVLELIKIANSD